MIRSRFLSNADRRELLACVKRQREDHGVARRANALLLLDEGKSCVAVARVLYLDDDTVRGWHKQYVAEGWESVAYDGWKGGQSRMSAAQEAALCAWLEGRFCRSTVEIRAHVQATFGLRYSHSGCVKLLARLGFEYRKPKALPRGTDVAKQVEFIGLYEDLLTALPADEAVYFADAVQLLAKSRPETPKNGIHVIWGNAASHKRSGVRAFLARKICRIHLIQLPPYCPHLNPALRHVNMPCRAAIARLWAVMHRHVTHNRCYPTPTQFTAAILRFFRETVPKNWRDFRSQVTDNFRIISNQNFRVLE